MRARAAKIVSAALLASGCVLGSVEAGSVRGTLTATAAWSPPAAAIVRLYLLSSTGRVSLERAIAGKVGFGVRFHFDVPDGRYLLDVDGGQGTAYRRELDVRGDVDLGALRIGPSDREGVVEISFSYVDDDARVILNGSEVMTWSIDGTHARKIPLRKGANEFEVRIFNKESYTGGLAFLGGHQAEGWSYGVRLVGPDGEAWSFSAGEERPAARGPRHGREFAVLRGTVVADPVSGRVSVVVDQDVWKRPRR
jgi:hypothetical protein